MNSYIPSTADIRHGYSLRRPDKKNANHMFDLWLKSYRAKQIAEAEQRIIKLLEADCKDGFGDNIQGCSHEVAIALIKGEKSASPLNSEQANKQDKGENK